MGDGRVHKSVQYSVYCFYCDNLEDYQELKNQKKAERHYRNLGWRKEKHVGWVCPKHHDKEAE